MQSDLPASVPGPAAPDDGAAWYAPDVRSQYAVTHGVVATVREADGGYRYDTREPQLSVDERAVTERASERFGDVPSRPRTRAGAIERVDEGLPDPLEGRIDALEDRSPAGRRRLGYHLLAELRSLGPLTPYALDDRIRIADTSEDCLTVHTRDFAPARTELPADVSGLDRFLGERVARRTVPFAGFEVPVTIVREHVIGEDTFETTYVIEEPDRYPGDAALIETVKDRILEAPPEGVLESDVEAVRDRARTLLGRRLGFGSFGRTSGRGGGPLRGLIDRLRPGTRPKADIAREDRIDALAYYVVRDLVGDGPLTIPLRDPTVGAIEANRIGDRITVVSHREATPAGTRMPTTLSIDDRAAFDDLVRSLSADGGVELSADRPDATVSLTRETAAGRRDLTCSMALPDGAGGEHVSISAERETPPTPVAMIERGQLSEALVAAIWTVADSGGSVLFLGPADAEPAAVLGAHTPFVPADARPVELGPGAPRVDLPHETAISVRQTGAGPGAWSAIGERDALHPDVAVMSGLDGDRLGTLGTVLSTGRPVLGAVRTASRHLFAHRLAAAGVATAVRSRVALVVELPAPESTESATGWVPVRPGPAGSLGGSDAADGTAGEIAWERFAASDGRDDPALSTRFLDRLEAASEPANDPEMAFRRRHRYVAVLRSRGTTDRDSLLGFLSDLRTDEAATVERIGGDGDP